MPFFAYRALDPLGRRVRGTLAAVNETDLELRLKRMGLDLLTLRELDPHAPERGQRRVTRDERIVFALHMGYITRAGIPVLDGLRDLRDGMEHAGFRDILTALIEDLEGGKSLSQALAAHPHVFDGIFVQTVRAGETSGRLDQVFERLTEMLGWQDELARRVKRLLVYPILVLAVVGVAIVFLLTYLVPQIMTLLGVLGIELPWPTLALMAASRLATHHGLWMATLIGTASLALWGWTTRTPAGRDWWHGAQLKLPVLGAILTKIAVARFTTTLALLYRSGVPLIEALAVASTVTGNQRIAGAIRQAAQRITEGRGLTAAFQSTGLFPPLVIRMLHVGETTGALDAALDHVTTFYNREVSDAVENGLRVLEPALTLVLGLVLGSILIAVLLPIYDLIGNLPL